jgi:hypothetical protein
MIEEFTLHSLGTGCYAAGIDHALGGEGAPFVEANLLGPADDNIAGIGHTFGLSSFHLADMGALALFAQARINCTFSLDAHLPLRARFI